MINCFCEQPWDMFVLHDTLQASIDVRLENNCNSRMQWPTASFSFAMISNLLQQSSFSLLRQQTQRGCVHFLLQVWTVINVAQQSIFGSIVK